MEDLIKKVDLWSRERNLHKAKPIKQGLKFVEEFGETSKAYIGKDAPEVVDGLGDMLVVLIVLGTQLGISMEDLNINFDKYSDSLNDGKAHDYVDMMFSELNVSQAKLFSTLVSENTNWYKDRLTVCINGVIKLSYYLGYNADYCLGKAYDEIKDRKGILHNDVFIKLDTLLKNREALEKEGVIIPKEWLDK